MGISNSIGSNVFDVLLCLGLPWFLKAALFSKEPGNYYVTINSQGLIYSSISLFSTLTVLYLSLLVGKFKLTRSVGIICLTMYMIFLIFASILELNIFFMVNLPICIDWYFNNLWLVILLLDFNIKIEFFSLILLLFADALIAYLNCSIMNLISILWWMCYTHCK